MRASTVLLALLLSPGTGAACEWPIIAVGSGIVTRASKADRREIEQLLGTPLDHVACGRMQRIRRYSSGFTLKRGFLVLTKDEALFISDAQTKAVLFRTSFAFVRHAMRSGLGDNRFLIVALDDAEFRFELACDAVAVALVDEFELRTAPRTRTAPTPSILQTCTN
jgi:hypothetical protein